MLLKLNQLEEYGSTVLDQTKSFQIYINLLIGFVFGRISLDPKEYFKTLGYYLGKGMDEYEEYAKIHEITKKLE